MSTRPSRVHTSNGQVAERIFAANDRLNQLLIERLVPEVWTALPPGPVATGKGGTSQLRTVAAIFTHVHNVRCKWIRLTAPHLGVPAQLNRLHCTPEEARAALAESAARCAEMLSEALDGSGCVQAFNRDGWVTPWPAGMEMLCYMVAHEAHHRGQVSMLAHQLGFPLAPSVTSDLWNWEKLWRECGWSMRPGAGSQRLSGER
jgi:uncharacterized damage-inducible protein DinB